MKTTTARMAIIDDIRSVVEMLATKIPWENHGIDVIGKAMDGEDGLALITKEKPDIVITDIRMPKLDGLEMIRNILKVLPHCKIIIMSGYTDFEYARQAVALGAVDFVTKPFTINEITRIVLKAKQKWLEEEQNRTSVDKLRKQVQSSMPILRQEYLTMIVQFQAQSEKLDNLWNFLELKLEPRNLAVIAIDINNYVQDFSNQPVQEVELIRFTLQNILEYTLQAYTAGVLFREAQQRFIMLVQSTSNEATLQIAEACCKHVAEYTKFTISAGVGNIAPDLTSLSKSYRQALTALSYHFYTGGNGVFHYKSIENKGLSRPNFSFKHEEKLVFALQSGNHGLMMETLNTLMQEIKRMTPYPAPDQVISMYTVWVSIIYRTLLSMIPADKLRAIEQQVNQIISSKALPLQHLHEWIIKIAEDGCKLVLEERKNESQQLIHRAIEYVQSHLHEKLTVDRCAKVVNLSSGYFANLFKSHTGITFNQFVTQERIEQAKKMLVKDMPVQDIAIELGYEHRRYFSDVFKKHTGMTPSEFKEYYFEAKK